MSDYLNSLFEYLKSYEGYSTNDLFSKLHITSDAKSKNYILSQALINSFEGKEIAKIKLEINRINVKTIQLKNNGNSKESMSFAPINFTKIVDEEWENSEFKRYLDKDFIFFVFQQKEDNNILVKIIKWKVPEEDLCGEIKLVWEDTKKKISEGTIIKEIIDDKYSTWFLSEKITNICHVRPHASNGSDVAKLPTPDRLTGYDYALKHSFWFNHAYLNKIVKDN